MSEICKATPADVPTLLKLIRELADFEKLRHEVVGNQELLHEHLFGAKSHIEALLAKDSAGDCVGFALFFHNYSTFLTRPGLYLEDLYVKPSARGCGYGKKLLKSLAQIAVKRACGRMEWSVLDWNSHAISFYESIGAQCKSEWKIFRLSGDALQDFAQSVS